MAAITASTGRRFVGGTRAPWSPVTLINPCNAWRDLECLLLTFFYRGGAGRSNRMAESSRAEDDAAKEAAIVATLNPAQLVRYKTIKGEKVLPTYTNKSFFFIPPSNGFRKIMIQVAHAKWFDNARGPSPFLASTSQLSSRRASRCDRSRRAARVHDA